MKNLRPIEQKQPSEIDYKSGVLKYLRQVGIRNFCVIYFILHFIVSTFIGNNYCFFFRLVCVSFFFTHHEFLIIFIHSNDPDPKKLQLFNVYTIQYTVFISHIIL